MITGILSPELASLDIEALLRETLVEAEVAGLAGELPIGAVLVMQGEILSRGHACHRQNHSRLMHAEMQALLHGGMKLWEQPNGAVLLTSVEPCPMCLGAAVMANVKHIIFASHDAVVDLHLIVDNIPYIRQRVKSYYGGILEEEARALFARFNPDQLHYMATGVSLR